MSRLTPSPCFITSGEYMGSLGGKLIQLVKGQFFWTLRVQRSQSRCVGVAHQERTAAAARRESIGS